MGVVAPNNSADARAAASPTDRPKYVLFPASGIPTHDQASSGARAAGINRPAGISRWQPDPSQPERPKKGDRIEAPKARSSHLPPLQDALLSRSHPPARRIHRENPRRN